MRTALTFLVVSLASLHHTTAAEPVTPSAEIRPFDTNNLSDFTTWLKADGQKDPSRVFTVRKKTLHISGVGAGYLATKNAYRDYHLNVEYKWGKKTDDSGNVRNSGILIHAVGPDGGRGGVWMTSIECQLAQGCEGDLIVIRGKDKNGKMIPAMITCDTVLASDRKTRWKRGGKKTVYSGRQFWWSKHQPFFKEKIDTRGKNDVASPLGEWTKVEVICAGRTLTSVPPRGQCYRAKRRVIICRACHHRLVRRLLVSCILQAER